MIMVEQSMPPIQLVRGKIHTDWAVGDLSFDFYPLVNLILHNTYISKKTGSGIYFKQRQLHWVDANFPNVHINMKVS